MKRLDLNRDGEISGDELYKVLSKVDSKLTKAQLKHSIDQLLRKLASGADEFPSMKDYVKTLMKQFDKNNDGLISFEELCEGLKFYKVNLNQ